MERILRDNEKIRKAEEIYFRRNNRNASYVKSNYGRQKTYLGSKILLEMLILLLIAGAVFAVKNRHYIFTQEFLNNFSKYNINITEKFNKIMGNLKEEENTNQIFINNDENNNSNVEQPSSEKPIQAQENSDPIVQEQSKIIVNDIESLKNAYNFIKPIEGIVSSGFGSRYSKYQNVSGEHTGIDIAADSGTKIKSAISGIVTQVSSEGDYGNHIKICKDNVTTLYAHCQDIYVVEGQEIIEGQDIASVGSTGNSTGPHLHFEIRIDNNPINPADIILF